MFPNEELARELTKSFEATARSYPYQPGDLFLGKVPVEGGEVEIGVSTKRHALTIAGARAGKGVGLIIPNLLRWPHNALVIDPKGEAAIATAEARERMGQAVHVLDPFGEAKRQGLPDRFQARFNPLAALDPADPRIREDIGVIVDGLVMRHDARAAHWDGGAASLIAGLIAHIVSQADAEHVHLSEMRSCLTLPSEAFDALLVEMSANQACGNLPAAGAARLNRSANEAGHFLSGADENTKWLDSPPIAALLKDSTFDLADLRTKPTTVYLVLPADLVGEHGRFLRLFVRAAINAMARAGARADARQCLFLLDEFYALGRIDEIAKAAGLMPGYGVKLWPFLQDLNQLIELYGRDGSGTFFGNADVHQFFGTTDRGTLEHIAARIGMTTVDDIPLPPAAPVLGGSGPDIFSAAASQSRDSATRGLGAVWGAVTSSAGQAANSAAHKAYQDQMNEYQRAMSRVGDPRIPPDQVAALVQLKADVVADGSVCFVYGSEMIYVQLAPYFRQIRPPAPGAPAPGTRRPASRSDKIAAIVFLTILAIAAIGHDDPAKRFLWLIALIVAALPLPLIFPGLKPWVVSWFRRLFRRG